MRPGTKSNQLNSSDPWVTPCLLPTSFQLSIEDTSLFPVFKIFLVLFIIMILFGCAGSSLYCTGFSLRWLLLLGCTGSRHLGFSSVQSLSCVRLFVTPWTTAHQASLPITSSRSLLKLTPIESVMPSSHLIVCRPLLLLQSFPASGSFPMSQCFTSGGQSIGHNHKTLIKVITWTTALSNSMKL